MVPEYTRLRRMRRFAKNPVRSTNLALIGPIHARIGPFFASTAAGEPFSPDVGAAYAPRPRIASSRAIALVWSVGSRVAVRRSVIRSSGSGRRVPAPQA